MSANKPLHKATHTQMGDLAVQLINIEQELHRLGMHATARATNHAVQVIGYEFTGDFKAIKHLKEREGVA